MISAYIVYDVLVYFKINGSFNGYTIKGLYEMAKENSEKTANIIHSSLNDISFKFLNSSAIYPKI